METALVPLTDTMTLGKVLAESGFFADSRSAAQAVVKVLAGRELGFGPVASMTGVNIISGRVSLSANLIAAAVKRSGRYNYRVMELSDDVCRIDFFERGGERVGTSTFTKADAAKAGTKNMDKFPRNMLFARAMSNGAKWFCADVFGGPVYTPEELGADVNEEGEVIDVPTAAIQQPPADNGHDAAFEALPAAQQSAHAQALITDAQRKMIFALANKSYGKEHIGEFRVWLQQHYGTEHTSELTRDQASAIIDALQTATEPPA